ncbi:DNA polymerase III subunit delta [Nemorincola caseinilytica]|uniref:DNA polymerase III subunit delta n=1 Tax=Nemorincola caseinilytica TaxID=2054315 RepID=A0ABP8N6C2_9BACT
MNAEYNKIIQNVQMGQYAPVYLADGEEPYYLDKLTDIFENKVLQPHERDFNLTVLYGKDAQWQDVVSACRRFPMFAEKQVVILKDAAQLRGGEGDDKGLNALLGYIEHPSPSTIFFIEHPFKKADVRTRFVKRVKEKGVHFTSDKVKDERLPDWIEHHGKEIGFAIPRQEAEMLASYLGADLQKIANEIEKIRINVPEEKQLSAQLIQKYIGISKEYNIFDFPAMVTGNDRDKLYRMLSYFLANSKAAPMPLLIGSFYTHFNRLYTANFMKGKTDKEAAAALGMAPFFVKDVMAQLPRWPLQRVERCLLLLSLYSTRAVGIDSAADDRELLKEMVGRMLEA